MTELRPPDTSPAPVKLRVEDYHLLDQAGALDRFAKTELINGVILAVNATYSRHARAQRAMFMALHQACQALGLECVFELSVDVDEHNEPQPDILVARSLPKKGPVPIADVLLVVEIADTSLETDLKVKAQLYAAAGLQEYWVVDVERGLIHQLWAPAGEAYTQRQEVAFGEVASAATIPGLAADTAGI